MFFLFKIVNYYRENPIPSDKSIGVPSGMPTFAASCYIVTIKIMI
jgi:hypothetical protein